MISELLERPQRFSFFQAVRLLEQWLETSDSATSSRHSGVVSPRLSFRNSLSLSFAAGEVEALSVLWKDEGAIEAGAIEAGAKQLAGDDVEAVELTPAFMGLLGVSGTLPLHYTELIAQREWLHRDSSARAFLDVFTHRAVSLFYSAWKKHRLHVQYEADRRDRFLPLMLALSGLGQRGLRDRLEPSEGGVPDEAVAYFAGATQRRPVSAVQLRSLLQAYLGVPVRIDQFVGRWYTLPPEATTALGLGNGVLGASAIAGERVWQRDLCLRVVLGPLDRTHYLRFLPGGAGERALRQWLHLLCGVSFEYEVRLRLQREAVCGTTLSAESHTGRLGWDTFLCTEPASDDREDVVYDLQAA